MSVIAVILLLAIVLTVVIAIQRAMGNNDETESSGADIVAYLVLALSMGVAGFALAQLASTAFPGQSFVFDPAEEVATSLSALVVSLPFLVYFWRRQARRRVSFPTSAGWTLYLSLIELVFITAFVVSSVLFINGLVSDEPLSAWTGAVVFGAIVVFHEYSARVTPPLSDIGELRRVVGSAIGLITATIGLTGVLAGALAAAYDGLGGLARDTGFHPWLAVLIVGAPVWWFRWLRPWDSKPAIPKLTWTVIVAVGSLATSLGATTAIGVMVLQYLFSETPAAGRHFDALPVALALSLAGALIWAVHRRSLGRERSNAVQVYEYTMAAFGLATAVFMATALTIAAFSQSLLVGGGAGDVVTFATVLVAGLAVWLIFGVRREAAAPVPMSWPRRIYTLGLGVVFGLVAAGALITAIFILFRRLLADGEPGSLLEPGAVFLYSGLATWYLLRSYAAGRSAVPATDVVVPFEVTIVCSHPGMIATRFHEQARLRVIHRGDDAGVIGQEMAGAIVAAVDNQPSLVWVDEDGFRIAPKRVST